MDFGKSRLKWEGRRMVGLSPSLPSRCGTANVGFLSNAERRAYRVEVLVIQS